MPEPTMLPNTRPMAIGNDSIRADRPEIEGPFSSMRVLPQRRAIRGAQQIVKVLHALLALRVQAPGFVAARGEPPLHGFADRGVLDLHLVAEALVLRRPRRVGAGGIVVVELDAAAIHAEWQHPIGLQPVR